jgi:MoaA/NifB/PqqE/SkfB family radical SAM enzyme
MQNRSLQDFLGQRWSSNTHRDAAALNFRRYLENICTENINIDNFPWLLYLEPTRNCNLRCPACKADLLQPKYDNLTLDSFKEIIDDVGRYLYYLYVFRSGESFIHKHIIEMLEYAHKNTGAFINVSTNGSIRWSHDEMVKIVHCVDNLEICLDGITPRTHLKYRVRSNFDLILSNMMRINRLIEKEKAGCLLYWRYIVFKHNEHEVEDAKKMADDLGIPITFIRAEVSRGSGIDAEWLPTDRELWRLEYLDPSSVTYGGKKLRDAFRVASEYAEELGKEGDLDYSDRRLFSDSGGSGLASEASAEPGHTDIWGARTPTTVKVAPRFALPPLKTPAFSDNRYEPRVSQTDFGQCPWLAGGSVLTADKRMHPCCNHPYEMAPFYPDRFLDGYRSPEYAAARRDGICPGCNPNWITEWQSIFYNCAQSIITFLNNSCDYLTCETRENLRNFDLYSMNYYGLRQIDKNIKTADAEWFFVKKHVNAFYRKGLDLTFYKDVIYLLRQRLTDDDSITIFDPDKETINEFHSRLWSLYCAMPADTRDHEGRIDFGDRFLGYGWGPTVDCGDGTLARWVSLYEGPAAVFTRWKANRATSIRLRIHTCLHQSFLDSFHMAINGHLVENARVYYKYSECYFEAKMPKLDYGVPFKVEFSCKIPPDWTRASGIHLSHGLSLAWIALV